MQWNMEPNNDNTLNHTPEIIAPGSTDTINSNKKITSIDVLE